MATPAEELDLPTRSDLGENPSREEFVDEARRQREQNWLIRTEYGFHVVSYEDTVELLRDRNLHQASQLVARMIVGTGTALDQMDENNGILSAEGEDHTRLRRLVAQAFSPKAADVLRPFMRTYVQTVIDQSTPSGCTSEFEFQAAFREYPIAVICELIGVEQKDWDLFSHWAELLFIRWSPLIIRREQEYVDGMADFRAYCENLINQRRENLGDDLVSQLIVVEEEGDRLSTDELISLVQGMIAAGTDTTRNQLGNVMHLLATRPDQWQQLRDDLSLITTAVEESLRFQNPIGTVIRLVATSFEHRDVLFSPGQLISFSLSSANRDELKFDEPDVFSVARSEARGHLSFSSGIHHCLGAALARAELQEALRVCVEAWTTVELGAETQWKHGRLAIWGPASVSLRATRD